jgi:L-alanine-DL-glutamate epimerase-like enolase superfamily enzyme
VSHSTDPSLATAAHLHAWAALPGFSSPQEFYAEPHHHLVDETPVLERPLAARDGAVFVLRGPGLGVTVDEEVVRAAAQPY